MCQLKLGGKPTVSDIEYPKRNSRESTQLCDLEYPN